MDFYHNKEVQLEFKNENTQMYTILYSMEDRNCCLNTYHPHTDVHAF